MHTKLLMYDIINMESDELFDKTVKDILNAICKNNFLIYEDIYNYQVLDKSKYSCIQYKRVVQLAAIFDYKFIGQEYYCKWFKSPDLYLEKPYFSGDNREYLFLFAPQQFMRHNVFYDKREF